MSETRRDLFRTSVLSALGGVVVGAAGGGVAGYMIAEDTPRPVVAAFPTAGSVVAVYGKTTVSGKTARLWYFFKFDDSDVKTCVLSSAPKGTLFPSIAPIASTSATAPSSTNAVDTFSWYSSLQSKSKLSPVANATNLQITYNATSGSSSITVTTDGSGKLDPTSLGNLTTAIQNDVKLIPGSWNEIGHN